MQWIHVPSQSNVRRKPSKYLREKKEYLKAKIEEIELNSNIINIMFLYRGINGIKKGYQPRTNIVKDMKDYFVAYSHSILSGWRNYFSQLLNVKR